MAATTPTRPPASEGRNVRWWARVSPVVAGGSVAVLLVLWSTRDVWGGQPPAGEDVMAHLVRLDFGISELVVHGRLDGWLPRFYVGYQEFLFNGPGLVWAVAGLRGLTLGLLSNTGGLKVLGVLALAAVPLSVAFFARSVGLSRLAAGIAAVLSLLVSNVFGVGLLGNYLIGLVSQQLGAPLFFVTLGALLRIPVDRRARWVVISGVALAALAVTHLISVMVIAVFFPLLAVALVRRRTGFDALQRMAFAGLIAAGLAAWWLVPLFAHRDLSGAVATWGTPPFGDRVDEIINGRILFRPYTVWIVFAGWAYAVVRVRNRRPFALALVLAPIVYLVFAHWAASRWPGNDFTLQLANRGLGYAGVIALLPAAAALADGAAWVARRLRSSSAVAAPIAGAGALLVAAALVMSSLGPDRAVVRQLPEPVPELRAAAAELAERVPVGARFATERDYPAEVARLGVLQPATWLARESGRNSLNGFNLESSSTPAAALEPERIGKVSAEMSADALHRLGVSHVVTVTDKARSEYEQSSRYTLVWREGAVSIFELNEAPRLPSPRSLLFTEAPATARLVEGEPEHVRIVANSEYEGSASVAIAWSPKWHGTVNGVAVDLGHTQDGLIAFRLPAGRSTIDLTYAPDKWDRIGVLLSFLTVSAVAAWAVLHRRRRRRLGADDDFELEATAEAVANERS